MSECAISAGLIKEEYSKNLVFTPERKLSNFSKKKFPFTTQSTPKYSNFTNC